MTVISNLHTPCVTRNGQSTPLHFHLLLLQRFQWGYYFTLISSMHFYLSLGVRLDSSPAYLLHVCPSIFTLGTLSFCVLELPSPSLFFKHTVVISSHHIPYQCNPLSCIFELILATFIYPVINFFLILSCVLHQPQSIQSITDVLSPYFA